MCKERAETLSCRAAECGIDCVVRQTIVAIFLGYCSRKHSTHRSIGVFYAKVQFNRHLRTDGRITAIDYLTVEHLLNFVMLFGDIYDGSFRSINRSI